MKIMARVCLIASAWMIMASWSQAQDLGIFSGKGIRVPGNNAPSAGTSTSRPSKSQSTQSRWSELMDFSVDAPDEDSRRFRLFHKPDFDWKNPFRRDLSENQDSGKLPSWLPRRDPGTPGLFEQMNSRSRNLLGRTHDWAAEKNENLKNRTFEAWNMITQGRGQTDPDSERFGQGFGTSPPVRAADRAGKKPTVRF